MKFYTFVKPTTSWQRFPDNINHKLHYFVYENKNYAGSMIVLDRGDVFHYVKKASELTDNVFEKIIRIKV